MNIYFACAITGGRLFEKTYQAITRALLADGHEVPTAHLASPGVMKLEQIVLAEDVFQRDTAWIQACDVLIAEISTPSHGVGFEVALALFIGKKVLCLHQEGQAVSKMIIGNTHPLLTVKSYRMPKEAVSFVRTYLSDLDLICEDSHE